MHLNFLSSTQTLRAARSNCTIVHCGRVGALGADPVEIQPTAAMTANTNERPLRASTLRNAVDSLREAIRLRQVVPVIGPDVLTVAVTDLAGQERVAPFYRLVAEHLLQQFSLSTELLDAPAPTWDLHRATQAVMAHTGQSAARLRRSVAAAIRAVAEQARPAGALRALAQLSCFELVVCLTPDDWLVQACAQAQPSTRIEVRSYTPKADTSQTDQDIPLAQARQLRVFQLLGRIDAATQFAIHEEDALEYLYRFREDGERRCKTLMTALRGNDLLFLGCSLPDWMGRGLMRLVNDERLAATERTMEFFCATARDGRFSQFLDRFSSQSTVFPWAPDEFVAQIATWVQGHPATPAEAGSARPTGSKAARGAPSVFVSYASEDAAAARRLAESLQSLGFGEVWFDKKRLIAGDDWSVRIDEALAQCDLFIPLLSSQADQRREGVFWEEWRQALARSLRVADSFIVPVGLDDQAPRAAAYQRIFSGVTRPFADLHLAHAPAGLLTAESQAQLAELARRFALGAGHG